MSEPLALHHGDADPSMLIPLWCRAQCRVLYPALGVGEADAEIISGIRADFSLARRSEPLLYALRESLAAGSLGEYLSEHPDAVLIDLGCGLDSALRLADNGRCRMVYADLPGNVGLRRALLPERERETYISCAAPDLSPLAGIDASGGACVLMCGLLCHLTEPDVRALFRSLAELFPGGAAVFDGLGGVSRLFGGIDVKSRLPGPRATARMEGIASVEALARLPENYAVLPAAKRAKLSALLRLGVLRMYSCTLEA